MATPAAQYLRMSTDYQEYSLLNQAAAISRYAALHDFHIVSTYSDEARSGLLLRERPELQRLLQDVMSKQQGYRVILVYDVSRWGRFQDMDEAAYYEFICKEAGVPVHYCQEAFLNDGAMANLIIKWLKRMMAGEYSRELSEKVYQGLRRIASNGFHTGSVAGYGMKRLLVSADREPKQILEVCERKNLATDRVILTPGPAQEVACVREIFRLFTQKGMKPESIAKELNRRKIPYTGLSRAAWYGGMVRRSSSSPHKEKEQISLQQESRNGSDTLSNNSYRLR